MDPALSLPADSPAPGTQQWPLTTLDDAFLLSVGSDRSRLNMCYEIHTYGVIDVDRLRAAVLAVCDRHPLLRGRLHSTAQGLSWWCPPRLDIDPVSVTACPAGDDGLDAVRSTMIDTPLPWDLSPPLRMLVIRRSGGDVIITTMNHGVGDGAAILRFISEVADSYRGLPLAAVRDIDRLLEDQTAPPPGPPDPRPRRERWRPASKLARQGGRRRSPTTEVVFRTVPVSAVLALRGTLPGKPSLNDVLLAVLHRTIESWNTAHGKPSRRLTSPMTANIRPAAWSESVIGNYSAGLVVGTWPEDRTDLPTAVEAIARQTGALREGNPAVFLHEAVTWMRGLPGGLRTERRLLGLWSSADRIVGGTSMLSNLQRCDAPIFDDDGRPPSAVVLSTPFGPRGVGLCVYTIGDQMYIVSRFRRAQFDKAAAREFLDLFVAECTAIPAQRQGAPTGGTATPDPAASFPQVWTP